MFEIKKAARKAKKLRIGVSAASGFGKTYGSLLISKGLVGDLSKVCVIDTEKDSASLYADLGGYSTLNLTSHTPESYIAAITHVENSGFECIIIDSITHEWQECLKIHAQLGGRFQDWANVTPRHNAFINKILSSTCHVITTVRRKQDYCMSNEGGKTKIEKLGLSEQTRDGYEYELDINFEIVNEHHSAKASKDRTRLFADKPEFIITEETGKLILDWSNLGLTETLDEALSKIRATTTVEELGVIYTSYSSNLGKNEDFVAALSAKKAQLLELKKAETLPENITGKMLLNKKD